MGDAAANQGGSSPKASDPQAYELTRNSGSLLFRRYAVQRELGRGGMGVVVLAQDTALDIPVAVKLVPDLVANDTEAMADLRQEVLRGIALTHYGIVRTYNFERDETGAGIVMEYVDGETLGERKLRQPGGCFDPADILPWLEMLCAVLDYAHRSARIVHRDLKPRNIMIDRQGRIKVADFGIAAMLSDTMTRNTGSGPTSGTPPYMSPQQARGKGPSPLDDIYSVGATIYELLTGKPPFFRGNIVLQVVEEVPPPMHRRREELQVRGKTPIPALWEEVIAACLAKDERLRPQRVTEIYTRLKDSFGTVANENHLSDTSVVPPPAPPAPPTFPSTQQVAAQPPPLTHTATSLRSQLPPAGTLPPPIPAPVQAPPLTPPNPAPKPNRNPLLWLLAIPVLFVVVAVPLLLGLLSKKNTPVPVGPDSTPSTPPPIATAYSTPAPSILKPAATAVPAPIKAETAEEFVRRYVDAGDSGSLDDQVDFFAESARYFDEGTLTRDQIDTSLTAYSEKWPQRTYRLAGPIEVSSTNNGNGAQVKIALEFTTRNKYQQIDGKVRDYLTLNRTGRTWEITAIRSDAMEPSRKTPIRSAVFGPIKQEHNLFVEGVKVMKVTFPLTVSGSKGRDIRVCLFVNKPDGTPVPGLKDNRTPTGQLTAQDQVSVKYDDTEWANPPFTLYVPYANFDLPSGSYTLTFELEVHDQETGDKFASSEKQTFTFSR